MFILIWLTLLFKVMNISSSTASIELSGNPTLMIPPLIEGQQTSLTCTADLCSDGESPDFVWIWTKSMENNSFNTKNVTEYQRLNSTVTFNPSAEHHGSAVTCQVTCSNNMTANVTEVLNVTYVKKPEITGEATVKEGDTLNLTCTVDSFPPSAVKWSKLGMKKSLTNDSRLESKISTLIIHDVMTENFGQYFCTATHLNNLTQGIIITGKNLEELEISREKTIEEGDTLNLTCHIDGFPQSPPSWTKLGFNTSIINGTGAATLFINIVKGQDSGQYICRARHQNMTLTENMDITVKHGSLNLTCSTDSFLPSVITWPKRGINKILNNETEYGTSTLVINNVSKEHSGQYLCSANHLEKTLEQDINITVTNEKKLKIIGETALKEGDTLNLTCTEEIFPSSIIMWTKNGKNKTLINETQSDNSRSNLVIPNITAEDSGQYICTAQHLNNTLTEKVDVLVTYVWKMKITGEPTVREGDDLNLTCSVESFHPHLITWTKLGLNKTLNETGTEVRISTLIIHNVTTNDSGQYFCTTKFLTTQIRHKTDINITVTYQRRPKITGVSAVTEGRDLNVTCSVDSWPLALITWTKPGLSTVLKNDSGAATLLIVKVTAEDSGLYICIAKHPNIIITEEVHIRVKMLPKILDESGCEVQLDVLTCLCISQGFPSPTVTWERLENHVDYSINTAVTNYTVKSTISLSLNVKDNSNISAVCVSSNRNGETSRNLTISRVKDEGHMKLLKTFTQMGTIIPFLIGVLLSASISCLLLLCFRKKQKSHGSTSETLEMVMTQEANGGHTVDYEPIQARETAEGSDGSEAGASDIEYSDINLLLVKQEIASPAEKKPKKEDTEYAKIRPKGARMAEEEERQEEEEMKLCVPQDEESEAVAVYSNVTNLIDKM